MSRRPKHYDRGSNSRQRRRQPQTESRADQRAPDPDEMEDWERDAFMDGQRAALDGMDLPDGAYFAMAEEMGLDPY